MIRRSGTSPNLVVSEPTYPAARHQSDDLGRLDLASDSVAVVGGSYAPARDSAIQLPDGRALAYAEWGDPDGRPVFYFHGMPASRLFVPDPEAAAGEHVRLIAADRPGMGGSDPQPGHVVADWPADVVALADALGLERFGVVG